jgi:hypothetical protein
VRVACQRHASRSGDHPAIPRQAQGNGPLEKEADSVVAYKSASIDGAESTRVIHSGHSVQETPDGVVEVRRILSLNGSTQEKRNAN